MQFRSTANPEARTDSKEDEGPPISGTLWGKKQQASQHPLEAAAEPEYKSIHLSWLSRSTFLANWVFKIGNGQVKSFLAMT